MKLALLLLVITLGVVHCNPMNISDTITASNESSVITAVLIDSKDQPIPSLNQTSFNQSEPLNSTDVVHGYYNWLNFLKSSTSTVASNATFILKSL